MRHIIANMMGQVTLEAKIFNKRVYLTSNILQVVDGIIEKLGTSRKTEKQGKWTIIYKAEMNLEEETIGLFNNLEKMGFTITKNEVIA